MKEYPYISEDEEASVAGTRNIPFLGSFDEPHVREILRSSRICEYEEGETIIREGDTDAWLYVLMAGRARVVKGKSELATLQTAGDIFGEMALAGNRIRSASVLAMEKSYCLAIDANALEGLAPAERSACYALFYRMLSRILADRVKSTSMELARVRKELDGIKAAAASRG